MNQPAVFPIALFGPIAWWVSAVKCENVFLHKQEEFTKQTFRNRIRIVGPNNEQWLSFPISRVKGSTFEEVKLVYLEKWPVLHRRSLQAAYGKAPYYEHFSSFLDEFFTAENPLLVDKCLSSINWIKDILRLPVNFIDTPPLTYSNLTKFDFEKSFSFTRYRQVFEERHGFVSNASILDLMFNLGPDSREYLNDQIPQLTEVPSST